MLGYTTKTSNNKLLFKKIDKNPFVILQKMSKTCSVCLRL